MTTFDCSRCHKHWNEGPLRDHHVDQPCRACLQGDVDGLKQALETIKGNAESQITAGNTDVIWYRTEAVSALAKLANRQGT